MPEWLKDAVFYEIYPQSFKDSNSDGIGDFEGIISKLDYIKELGCNAIWMNPCYESPFCDAGYDVADYYKAAPRYGTNDDLKRLFDEAHKRGIHVLLDLVPGHTSIEHKWFKESMKAEKNEYSDRYIWTDNIWTDFTGISNISGSLRGISDRDGACATNFFSTQPALNYGFSVRDEEWMLPPDAPACIANREEMKNVMRFWMNMGCDGFRIDMAHAMVKNDPDDKGTIELWKDFRRFMDEEFPDNVMLSEWGAPEKSLAGGFHMDFLLHFGPSHYLDLFRVDEPYFSRRGKGDVSAFVKSYLDNYNKTNGKGLMCIPSGNHDMSRIAEKLDYNELKIAFAFLLTMPGAPFIYYGDEIGMKYLENLKSKEGGFHRTGARTPMQWDNSTNAGFSCAAEDMLYIQLDPDKNRPNVKTQMQDENSLWHTVKELIEVRKSTEALGSDSPIDFIYADENAYPFVYTRGNEGEKVLIALNPSEKEVCCDIEIDSLGEVLCCHGGDTVIKNGKLCMPKESFMIARI